MARGIEDKKVVDAFLKEFKEGTDFLQTIIPCIIPASEEDGKKLADGLKVMRQINKFIEECDGDIGRLDELFDTDKIVEEYPSLERALRSNNGSLNSGFSKDEIMSQYGLTEECEDDDME